MSTTATLSVRTAVRRVEEAVEKIINDAEQHFPAAASVGDAVRQGDVYIQLIDDVTATPFGYRLQNKPEFPIQLAPGNTKGSRHMLEASDGVVVYKSEIADLIEAQEAMEADGVSSFELRQTNEEKITKYAQAITGESDNDARSWNSVTRNKVAEISAALMLSGPIFVLKNPGCISHPEHGNWMLPPGSYRITFQRTLDSAQNVRRVFD